MDGQVLVSFTDKLVDQNYTVFDEHTMKIRVQDADPKMIDYWNVTSMNGSSMVI